MRVWPNIQHLLGGSPELQVDEEEDDADQEADAADHDVGDPKEGVLASEPTGGGQDDTLGSFELINLVVILDVQLVLLSMRQSVLKV